MAVSLAFGAMFATAITLVLVPSGYVIMEDLKGLVSRLLGRRESPDVAAELVREGER